METEKANLSDMLGETAPAEQAAAPSEPEKGETAETETAKATEETEAKTDDAADKGEPPSPDETQKPSESEAGLIAALKVTRKELQGLKAWKSEQEQKQTQAAKPDPFEDPEGHEQWKDQQTQTALWNNKVQLSEALARQQYGDEAYDKAYEAFIEEANSNPAVANGVGTALSPAHYAYEQGMKAIERAEMGDPATFAERKFQEGYEKAKAELTDTVNAQVKAALADILPTSLATEQSQGDRGNGPAWDGPKPMDQLLSD